MLSSRPISLNSDVNTHSTSYAKTPGRKTLKGRHGLQENAVLHTVGPKTVITKKAGLQTPFRPGTAQGKKPILAMSAARPLMDKTPFPNRVATSSFGGAGKTPGPQGLKLSKLSLLVPEPEESLASDVAPLLRPSNTRKSLRGRLSGNFKTPLTKGNYWDVSPGDEVIGAEAQAPGGETVQAGAVEEDDELEYMPPSAVELPYKPPFDMPDYTALGASLFALGHGEVMDDTASLFYAMDIDQQVNVAELVVQSALDATSIDLNLPEIEDDAPFAIKLAQSKPPPAPMKSSAQPPRAIAARTASARAQPPPRPATVSSLRPSASKSTPSVSRIPAPALSQTRTTALRAAKAAASSGAPHSAATTSTRLRSTTALAAGPSARARPASAGAAAASRQNVATGTGKVVPGAPKSKSPDDLASVLEAKFTGQEEDFAFDI